MKKKVAFVVMTFLVGISVAAAYPYLEKRWAQFRLASKGYTDGTMSNSLLDQTRFVEAACNGDDALLFVKAGYAPDSVGVGHNGMAPLHCAAMRGDMQLAQALLDKRTNPKQVTATGNFEPIHFAAAFHHLDVVKLLIRHGADINRQSDSGTPLMVAASQRDGIRQDAPGWHSRISIKRHIDPVNAAIYDELIKLGARTDTSDKHRNTLLHVAAATHNRTLAEMLLRKGMDINAANVNGVTPFLLAVRNSHVDGASKRTVDLDFIALMISLGAYVNARDIGGRSAIFNTIPEREDLLDLLIKHGADINVASEEGASVWPGNLSSDRIIAWAEKFPHIGVPLRLDGTPGRGPLHVYARAAAPELVTYFLKRGGKASVEDFRGYTPLHDVLESTGGIGDWGARRREIAKLLLAAGADVNARTREGVTPLMVAVDQSVETIRFLVENGADVKATAVENGKEYSVLDRFKRGKNAQALEFLTARGGK